MIVLVAPPAALHEKNSAIQNAIDTAAILAASTKLVTPPANIPPPEIPLGNFQFLPPSSCNRFACASQLRKWHLLMRLTRAPVQGRTESGLWICSHVLLPVLVRLSITRTRQPIPGY